MKRKICLLTPWKWREKYDWFRRDLGLVCDGLCRRGHAAELIVLHAEGMPRSDARLVGATESELGTTSWWAARSPDLVISIAGFRPSAIPVHMAVRAAGIPLWNKMDSDGVIGLRVAPRLALYNMWVSARQKGRPLPALRSLALYLSRLATRGDQRGIEMIRHADRFLIETPVAVARMRRFFLGHGRSDLAGRVSWLPGPVPMDRTAESSTPRENRVIAVGRWVDFSQKNTPQLFRVLRGFLMENPTYRADVIGLFDSRVQALHERLEDGVRQRIILHGRLRNEELTAFYQRSKISLSVSRVEGFPNVGAESVCCGCSIVAPAHLVALAYLAGSSSGTLSCDQSDGGLIDALSAEAIEWDRGARDPVGISRHFRGELSADAVADMVERLLELELESRMPPAGG